MSNLPPYSTYRTDNKQQLMYPQQLSHGNVLTFTPPGFKQTLNVKFPDCRLAVCEKCKKNYKTRDMCRVRNSHTAEPWTTAYVCFTLDDNCTDADGKYIDKPFAVRMVQWQPYCVKKPFDPKTPVCSACKKTNRTRSFCRERHKHRQLPWCTVYVLLSPADTIDPATRVAPESTPVDETKSAEVKKEEDQNKVEKEEDKKPDDPDGQVKAEAGVEQDTEKNTNKSKKEIGGEEASDDINDISESRTFLAKVSCKSITIHWLELADFDATDMASMHGLVSPEGHMAIAAGAGMAVQPVDPAHYYAHTMGGYAAQQHQLNLKAQQQYFFHMQQRQHQQYAAQQAAWQAQYNRHSQMHLAAAAQPAPTAPAPPSASASAVTAGEAAAQQQSKQTDAAGATAASVAHSPWPGQQMMAYPHHMYHPQMPQYQQQPALVAQGQPTGHEADPYQRANGAPAGQPEGEYSNKVDELEPAPVHNMGEGTGESDSKRQRIV